jgi:hypothetical protein
VRRLGGLNDARRSMIDVQVLRELRMAAGPTGATWPAHLSAASGLVQHRGRLYVVADDELGLGLFDLAGDARGRWFALFDGVLPAGHASRKAAKPDLESLLLWPTRDGGGELLALGSGSAARRHRAVRVTLDAAGEPQGEAQSIELSELHAGLAAHFAQPNIEGAFIDGDDFCLLQRGHAGEPVNACVRYPLRAVDAWLRGAGTCPAIGSIRRYELGTLQGVPLSFTDGTALPGGGWLFCAAAEATVDAVADGPCRGSAVGWVDAAGELCALQPLSLRCKAEGMAVLAVATTARLLLVTDGDDRAAPALLLGASLPLR